MCSLSPGIGNTAHFYDWLRHLKRGNLPEGPPVWICGDCHVGNLGPLAHSDGRVEIQIRDLDQAVIGNPTHDLVRLGLSLASAARGSDLPGVTTARILEQIIEGYAAAMEPGQTGDEGDEADRLVPIAKTRAVIGALDSYYQLLVPICSKIDLWQTIYVHPLDGPGDIVEWFEGSGLRPFLDVLSPGEREIFLSRYRAELSAAYRRQPNGKVLLRYPRLFFAVQK